MREMASILLIRRPQKLREISTQKRVSYPMHEARALKRPGLLMSVGLHATASPPHLAHSGTLYLRHTSEYDMDFRLAISCSHVEPLACIEAASAPPGIRT